MKPEELYKKIIESTTEGVCVIDRGNNITYINESAKHFLHSDTPVTGRSIFDFIVKEDIPVLLSNIENSTRGIPDAIELRFKCPGKNFIWTSLRTNALSDSNGNYQGGFALMTDISENKELYDNVKKQDEILKMFFQNNPNPMWIYDKKTLNFLEVNNAAQLIYGYSRDEFLNMKVTDIRTSEDISKIKYYLERSNNKSLKSLFNIKHCYKDGTVVYVDIINNDVEFMGKKACLATISNATTRVKMQDALENSEKRYRILFENAGAGIIYMDTSGNIILINELGARNLNSTPEQLKGKNFPSLLAADIEASIKETFKLLLRERRIVERETNIGTKEKPIYYWISFQPLVDSNNEVKGIQAIAHDVTARRKSEQILRESETRFRHLFEDMEQIPVQGYNTSHEIIFWNKASEMTYGFTKDEAIGKKIEDLIITDDQKSIVYNNINNFLNKGVQIPPGNIVLKKKNGKTITMFTCHVIIENYNKTPEMYSFEVDMTKRVEAENKISFQAKMLNAVGQSVLVVDTAGNLIFINAAGEELSGWKREDVLNKYFFTMLTNEDLRKQALELFSITLQGKTWAGELQIQNNDRTLFPVYVTTSPIYDVSNELAGIVCVAVDISELKNKERELKAAKEKAEEMNRIKSAFLTNMSHELRTPLVGILGFSEILNEEVESEVHKNITNSILFSGKRLLTTLNAILDLSKIEADMMSMNYSEFAVISEIKSLLKVFDILAAKKGLKLKLDYNGSDFTVESDLNIFLQIIENLVHNALKFTETGSVELFIRKESETFTIKVKDTGIGIPPESQDLIFQEFRQVSEGYGRHFEGSGIGLTLTKRFVELLDGIIYVESKPNEGSTFSVCLPLKRSRHNYYNYTTIH
jgi:PAS domain S-box-containing protein